VLVENEDGTIIKYQQSFGGFKRDMMAMALWLLELQVDLVVMESTGIYWKSAYSHLERAGIFAMVVNAH
jgi:transposase